MQKLNFIVKNVPYVFSYCDDFSDYTAIGR